MWNSLDLQCPMEDVCEYDVSDSIILEELPHLVNELTKSAELLTEDNAIWSEIKVFQNVQIKYRRILHCDKCLHLLQRVGSCIRKMVLLNMSKVFLDLAEHFLVGLQNKSTPLLLPSSQQLEFVLIRTQSAAKLICEALMYSRETFSFLIQRLHLGHIVLNLLMATSVTARIHVLFKGILIQLFDIYGRLYPWLQKLKKGTWEWPTVPNLPDDLQCWLNPEAAELLNPSAATEEQLTLISKVFKNFQSAENQKEAAASPPREKEVDDCMIVEATQCVTLDGDSDTGEVLSREEVQIDKKTKLTTSQQVLLKKIESAKTLKKLKVIWNNIDVSSGLPQSLVPSKVRHIDHFLAQQRAKVNSVKRSGAPSEKTREEIASVVRVTASKLAKQLGLHGGAADTARAAPRSALQAAKTLKQLRVLYENLYQGLQRDQKYAKCDRLKRTFKAKRAEARLLIQNGDRAAARQRVLSVSKLLLAKFRK